jgi:hypothetical protein
MTASAYSQARYKLKHIAFIELNQEAVMKMLYRDNDTIRHSGEENAKEETAAKQKLLITLEKIVPLALGLSSALLMRIIFGILVSIWLGLFCYRLHGIAIIYSSIIVIISLIPSVILSRYYFILQDIIELTQKSTLFSSNNKQVPQDFIDDLRKIKTIKREDISAFNLIAQGKRIFELVNLVKSGKAILGQYINVAVLISPITLILLIGALIGLALLTLVFIITLVIAIT